MKKFNFKMLLAVLVAMLLVLVSIPVAFAEPSPTVSPTSSPAGSPFAAETPEVAKATAVDANGEEVNVDLSKVTITPLSGESGDATKVQALEEATAALRQIFSGEELEGDQKASQEKLQAALADLVVDGKMYKSEDFDAEQVFDLSVTDEIKAVFAAGGTIKFEFDYTSSNGKSPVVIHQNEATKDWVVVDAGKVAYNHDNGKLEVEFDSLCPVAFLQPDENAQPVAIQGPAGEDGHSPIITIGENGNWFIDGVDTNISAQGQQGEQGQQGQQGQQGPAGQNGQDGVTPTIEIGANGNWIINGVDTGIAANGQAGQNGQNGQNGQDGQPGQAGQNGQDGKDGKDGKDGSAGPIWMFIIIIILLVIIIILLVIYIFFKKDKDDNNEEKEEAPAEEEAQPEEEQQEQANEEEAQPEEEPVAEEPAAEEVVEEAPAEEAPAEEAAPEVEPVVVPVVAAAAVAEEEEVVEEKDEFLSINYNKSHIAKLVALDENMQQCYQLIKDLLCSYQITNRVSWKHETFAKSRETFARLMVRGKTLNLYVTVDVEKYASDPKTPLQPDKDGFAVMKIKSMRRTKYALNILKDLLKDIKAEKKKEYEPVDELAEFRGDSEKTLIAKGQIKMSVERGEKPKARARQYKLLKETSVYNINSKMDDNDALNLVGHADREIDATNFGEVFTDQLCEAFEEGEKVDLAAIKERVKGVDKKMTAYKLKPRGKMDRALTIDCDAYTLGVAKMVALTGGQLLSPSDEGSEE